MINVLKSFACTVLACAVLLPSTAAALTAGAQTSDRENYHRKGKWGYTILEDGTVAVSDYFGSAKNVKVPSKIDGYTVTALSGGWYSDTDENGEDSEVILYGNIHSIDYADDGTISDSQVYSPFSGNETVQTITLPDTITSIGAIAFKDCTSLTSIEFGSSLTIVGSNCFEGCTSLENITLPDTVEFVDQQAFYGCESLTEVVTYADRLETAVFENCVSLETVTLSDTLTSISPYLFSGCTSLKSVDIPNGVTEIGDSAFAGCTSLEQILLPDSVSAIYNNAFSGCTSLISASVGANLDTLGSRAFADCGLTELYLPDTLVRIGESAFGMSVDGEVKEGFTLTCPEYSSAQTYAEQSGINYALTAAASDSTAQTEQSETKVSSDTMFNIILAVLIIAAAAVGIALILMIKNSRTPMGED